MKRMEFEAPSRDDSHRMSQRLDDIRERLGSAIQLIDQLTDVPVVRPANQPVNESEIRAILRLRRNRARFFDTELFADPVWDILLELFAAELGQQRICVSSLCLGAAVPSTTALRWIKILENKGLIERKPDPMDGRRFFLSLSECGSAAMFDFFRTVPASPSLI